MDFIGIDKEGFAVYEDSNETAYGDGTYKAEAIPTKEEEYKYEKEYMATAEFLARTCDFVLLDSFIGGEYDEFKYIIEWKLWVKKGKGKIISIREI